MSGWPFGLSATVIALAVVLAPITNDPSLRRTIPPTSAGLPSETVLLPASPNVVSTSPGAAEAMLPASDAKVAIRAMGTMRMERRGADTMTSGRWTAWVGRVIGPHGGGSVESAGGRCAPSRTT